MNLTQVFETLASIGIGAAALAWLFRSLVSQLLNKNLERYKVELNAAHDVQIERLRTDLRAAAFEHETTFARLHADRATVIAELYKRLARTNTKVTQYMKPIQMGGEEQHKKLGESAADAANAFIEYFDENRIYLSMGLASAFDSLIEELKKAWIQFTVHSTGPYPDPKAWMDAWKKIRNDIPPLRSKIESEFRILLGVSQAAPELKLNQAIEVTHQSG